MSRSVLLSSLLALGLTACGSTGSRAASGGMQRPNVQAAIDAAPPPAASSSRVPAVDTTTFRLSRFPGGETVSLTEYRGRVLLLDLWATWCEPCVEALPAYQQLEQRYADRGLTFLALSLDEDPRQITRFLEAQDLSIDHLFLEAPSQPIASALKLRGLPTTYLIDRQGRLRHVHEGYVPEELPALVSEIERLLDEDG